MVYLYICALARDIHYNYRMYSVTQTNTAFDGQYPVVLVLVDEWKTPNY